MPYIVPVANGDFFEIRVVGTLHGQICISTFRYLCIRESGTGELDMEPLLSDFEGGPWNSLRAILSSEFNTVRLFMQKINPVRYVSFEKVPEFTAGEVSGGACPSIIAFCMRKRLPTAGRDQRGRWFFPGVPVSSETDSKVTTAVLDGEPVAELSTMLLDVLEGVAGVTLVPSLIVPVGNSYVNRGQIQTVSLDPVLRAQRRREVGRGI